MENVFEIKKQLRRGDFVTIAEKLGYCVSNVHKVMRGRHRNELIVNGAKRVLADRKKNQRKRAAKRKKSS